MGVSLECLHVSLVARVPDPQRLVVGCADDELAAWMKNDAPDPIVVSEQSEKADATADVPDADCLVSRARS